MKCDFASVENVMWSAHMLYPRATAGLQGACRRSLRSALPSGTAAQKSAGAASVPAKLQNFSADSGMSVSWSAVSGMVGLMPICRGGEWVGGEEGQVVGGCAGWKRGQAHRGLQCHTAPPTSFFFQERERINGKFTRVFNISRCLCRCE